MGSNEHSYPNLVELAKQHHDLPRQGRVQITGGFISKQDKRFVDNATSDPDPLLLSPGEGNGIGLFFAQQIDLIQGGANTAGDIPVRMSGNDERQRDIVEHGLIHE